MFIPKHRKLSKTRLNIVLRAHSLDLDQLPLIKIGDKAIMQLQEQGEKVNFNDVIEITRKSKTGGDSTSYYRRVVY